MFGKERAGTRQADKIRLVPLAGQVRWEPGMVFCLHGHFGCEEIFVWDAVFQVVHGTDPAGSWLRSLQGSLRRPWSEAGFTNSVKAGHLHAPLGPNGLTASI